MPTVFTAGVTEAGTATDAPTTPMIFPESRTRRPQYGYDNSPAENVKRTPADSGVSYSRDAWGRLRFMAQCEFQVSTDDGAILMGFYRINRTLGFTFYDFGEDYWVDVILGAAGAVVVPGKEIRAVTVDGLATGFAVSVGTGPLGEDVLTGLTNANHTVRWTGRRRYSAEFAGPVTRKDIGFRRVSITMPIRERF